MPVCLATTETVKSYVKKLVDSGCTTEIDEQAGVVIVKDGEVVVYKAIQKEHMSWIVIMRNGPNVFWEDRGVPVPFKRNGYGTSFLPPI